MNFLEIINAVIVIFGLPTIIGAAIYVGRKLQIIDDLKDFRDRFVVVEDRVETLWKDKFVPSSSPRQLNDKGSKILKESGIKSILDEKKDILLKLIREKDLTTAYDAEQAIEGVVMDIPKYCPDVLNNLKDGAFRTGSDIDAVLFVGSVYFRNQIFNNLGFSLKDIDKK